MNKRFEWTKEYSVGIPSIDEQHKHFFEIANKIIGLCDKENLTKEDVLPGAGELGDYAFYHLGTEEGYFDKYGYEDSAIHVAAHMQYRQAVNGYLSRIREENADPRELALEMALYSGDWLLRHILIMDKKYTEFLVGKGVH
jgi:hemerythrin-like metal-binding protein